MTIKRVLHDERWFVEFDDGSYYARFPPAIWFRRKDGGGWEYVADSNALEAAYNTKESAT